MNDLLEIKDLTVRYFQARHKDTLAVKEVSLMIEKGRTLGIVGESGCGKTTLALAITKLIPQNGKIENGQVIFEDRDLLKMNEKELTNIRGGRISYIFQEPSSCLNPVLTIGEQLKEAIRLHTAQSQKKYLNDIAIQLLNKVGINDPVIKMRGYPHQLSGGENQRVMIAMAISALPSLLILDEPTSALDVTVQAKIIQTLDTLKEQMGLSMLLITHDLRLAKRMCSRIYVMYQGSLIPDEHPYTKKLFNSVVRCPYL